MLLGCIADDFTGAGDLANTLSREGMRSRLYVGVPSAETNHDSVEAGIIALKSRSVDAQAAVQESLSALEWLKRQACRQFIFKYCSTFDSTPAGNIGPVAEALTQALGTTSVIVCPAFPRNGRTVYQGHLFVHDRLLSESGMEKHPLTPMTDPDIRRWLQRQCTGPVGLIEHAVVRDGPESIRRALSENAARNIPLVICDAVDDRDLIAIGTAAADAILLTGGSGIALALPANFRRKGLIGETAPPTQRVSGPALVLSGSCSSATREQVREYAQLKPSYEITAQALATSDRLLEQAVHFIQQHRDSAPLVFSSAEPERVVAAQRQFGSERIAKLTEDFFGALARNAVAAGVKRLVVAGGETSGAVVRALGIKSLAVGAEISSGVPALIAGEDDDCLALALKSGNFGEPAFFTIALNRLGTAHE